MMGPFSIVLTEPFVKVFLQGLQVAVYLPSESDPVELVQDSSVEALKFSSHRIHGVSQAACPGSAQWYSPGYIPQSPCLK